MGEHPRNSHIVILGVASVRPTAFFYPLGQPTLYAYAKGLMMHGCWMTKNPSNAFPIRQHQRKFATEEKKRFNTESSKTFTFTLEDKQEERGERGKEKQG
jgi:hypothetical protein